MAMYQIMTDSGSDLPKKVLEELGVTAVPLTVNFQGQTLEDSVDDGIRELYDAFREGAVATTSAINPDRWETAMASVLEKGEDVLVITFSSGLSATHQSAVIAAQELAQKYPDRTVKVVDSLCASLGQGLLVWHAAQKRKEGMSLEELGAWLEKAKYQLCHWFTVDDLVYLKRGGRVSATTALVGTMLKIKPVLHVDDEGHLISKAKVRGRKASVDMLFEKTKELALPGENPVMYICHGDCVDDARYLESRLKKELGVKEVLIGYTGAVIGSHSGPGTLAVFFLGQHR